jgi:hypothetical protein
VVTSGISCPYQTDYFAGIYVVIRAHECPGVITVDLDRTQEVAGSSPASSTLESAANVNVGERAG